MRLQEVLIGFVSPSGSNWQNPSTFVPETSEGTHILVLSDMVASERATLRAVWGDSDFYSQALGKKPPWQVHHEDQEEDEEEEDHDLCLSAKNLHSGDFVSNSVLRNDDMGS